MTVNAACHIHSDWSYDGKWPLNELAAEFRKRGYKVLLVTEHDRGFSEARLQQHRAACQEVSSKDLLVVPGIEYSDSENVTHILTWGLDSFLGEGLPTLQLLEEVKALHGVSVFAHPERRQAWTRYVAKWADLLTGIEVWNRKSDGWAPSSVAAGLLRGTDLTPYASLDFHYRNQMFPLSMELSIAGEITEESVVGCLRSRHCRAMAFSQPAANYLAGWRNATLSNVERMRRSVAPVYRWVRNLNGKKRHR